MRRDDSGALVLSPTDLSRSLACGHLTGLSLAVARNEREEPQFHEDPLLKVLIERGRAHERAYVDYLRSRGLDLVDFTASEDAREAVEATLDAMRSGRAAIAQAALQVGRWFGRPDVLRRVERAGTWGWSYEAVDTKLSQETKAGTILQLGLYSDLLREIQGVEPERFFVVTPRSGMEVGEEYRVAEHAAYVRLMRARLEDTCSRAADEVMGEHYPEPVDHCEVCSFAVECDARRRKDDHLSLVYGASRVQRGEFEGRGVRTLADLAGLEGIEFKPRRGSKEALDRVRVQARAQLASRKSGRAGWELREGGNRAADSEDPRGNPALGLARLPEPSAGDVFLDLESDAFVENAHEGGAGAKGTGASDLGREYLFGIVLVNGEYQARWGFTPEREKAAFDEVMDFLIARLREFPGMHVYHYGNYEQSAFKRLMGRHATRGVELDELLRGERFVDLFSVVRQGIVAGVERYSIKNLEALYGFERKVALERARIGLRAIEVGLERGEDLEDEADAAMREAREIVRGYNEDDCLSTLRLREWLEGERAKAIAGGLDLPRPVAKEEKNETSEKRQEIDALRRRLLVGVPSEASERNEEEPARWVLAHLIDWHDREQKAAWWEYFRLRDLPDDELFDERQAIAGMTFVREVLVTRDSRSGKETGTYVHRYSYPQQEMEIREDDKVWIRREGEKEQFATVVAVDRERREIDLKKRRGERETHPGAVFEHSVVRTLAQEGALLELAKGVIADGGVLVREGSGAQVLSRRLLLGSGPVLKGGAAFVRSEHESDVECAVRLVGELDRSVLAVQGPPGAGKTYAGARMIEALVKSGRRVGVVATSHKVVLNLLDEVLDANPRIAVGHKGDEDDFAGANAAIQRFLDNGKAREGLRVGAVKVLGGTSWMWARPEFQDAVDVLFVDEAGQMSLANVVASARAAKSLVLLGDPQQLDQPQKGAHPEGVGASALGHFLRGQRTMPGERGLFLGTTWRLPPSICSFTSEVFYEGRLHSRPGLDGQRLHDAGEFSGSGVFVVRVAHEGNRGRAEEEIDEIERLVARFTEGGVTWTNEKGETRAVTTKDVLIVAPYNAQVSRLKERLPAFAEEIGTVDKFQGQERAIAIYSMAASTPEDAPRGMEFLYSLNRFNVATSRARCAAIVVASPRLFEPECRTPRQIKLANALCRFRELADARVSG